MRDQRQVGGRHWILLEPVGPHPGEPLALARRWGAFPAPANVERHQQVKLRIAVAREGERCETCLLDDDAELLLELANECVFRSLALLDLAAGKLPQPCHRPAGGALCDQHATVGIDEGAGGDNEKLHAYDPSDGSLGALVKDFAPPSMQLLSDG